MFRATDNYEGSHPAISLQAGDILSAVHAVDDTWYIGHNDRTKQVGAFPASLVEPVNTTDTCSKPLPVDDMNTSMVQEKPVYANISKQIQQQLASRDQSPSKTSDTTSSPKPLRLDVNRLGKTKPERSIRLKSLNSSPVSSGHSSPSSPASKQGGVFPKPTTGSKGPSMPRLVRFESIKLEHSISQTELESSWQSSSFEGSHQGDHYNDHVIGSTENLNRRGKLSSFKSSTENLIASDKDEQRCLKAILGLVGGLFLGGCIFIIYRYIFGYTFQEVGISVAVLTLVFCLCLALSSFLRHVMLLVVPTFFTGIGRTIMLSAIFALILQYPISNLSTNAQETGRSMSCIIDIAVNQSKILQEQLKGSLHDISVYVDKQERELREATSELHEGINNAKNVLDKIFHGAKDTAAQLNALRQLCQDTFQGVKTKCESECNSASFPLTEICKKTLKPLCNNFSPLTTVCDDLTLDFSSEVLDDARSALENAVQYFDVDIEVSGYYRGTVNTSKQISGIQKEIEDDIGAKVNIFHTVSSIILKCLPLPLLVLIIIQSFWYLRSYLSKDGYDNVYITTQFKKLDNGLGENRVLPLKSREKDIYIDTRSLKLNKTELSFCWIGLMQVGFHFLMCLFVTLFDYALYYVLRLVADHGDIKLDLDSDTKLSVEVEGTGPAAEFYRIMVQGYNVDTNYSSDVDISPCLPNASEPTHSMIAVFIVLYLLTLALVMLRGYVMRLRVKCAANYCPEQEIARLDYLHKRIRHKRVGFLRFIRQQIKSAHKEEKIKNQLRFSTWLRAHFSLFDKILPESKTLVCTSCEQRETSFTSVERCKGKLSDGEKCSAAYCKECLDAINGVCPLCTDEEDLQLRD
ncbi:DC-STAMP domain-containing protein 1 [Mactra antiquata]